MIRLLLLKCILLLSTMVMARTIVVKNMDELNSANADAQPGDIIILQNGEWKDVILRLNCKGSSGQPITFKAQTPGKVIISGHSQLKLGGAFIIADGLYFTNGYAGNDAVIDFRINKDQLANNCRVTNCVINDFNNPKRMDENYWISFSGKHNRVDHCSFKDKKNMGVLMAVILDDDRSRENFHSIDHNYFGRRPPLASNSGEIIRVGVSQHCEFNSNTQITDNLFEYCDGETEIISIKSCSNLVKNNVFKECQGGVVLRHGNYNTVADNLFLGNNKEGTGGVRIINKGQWVVNNLFYSCRGVDFRSPLSVMNGVPNSPAFRYVQVTDAVIANNTFYNCSSASFCEGSDSERTMPPANVYVGKNVFYNTRDSIIYKTFDNVTGFTFSGNKINNEIPQPVTYGFSKTSFSSQKYSDVIFAVPEPMHTLPVPDSLQQQALKRLGHTLSSTAGLPDGTGLVRKLETNAYTGTGAAWFKKIPKGSDNATASVNCANAAEVYFQLEKKEPVTIALTGHDYILDKPFLISKRVTITSGSSAVSFASGTMMSVFVLAGHGDLSLEGLNINGNKVAATHFISSDSAGSSAHYNLAVRHCSLQGFNSSNGCNDLFFAYKYMVADSIIFRDNSFTGNKSNTIMLADEKDDKGYYNAENIVIGHNVFTKQKGVLLDVYRGGNDESTMGPRLFFSHNKISDCDTKDAAPLIRLTGAQLTNVFSNHFSNDNAAGSLILYTDKVRARHIFEKNVVSRSGSINKNNFVTLTDNTIN